MLLVDSEKTFELAAGSAKLVCKFPSCAVSERYEDLLKRSDDAPTDREARKLLADALASVSDWNAEKILDTLSPGELFDAATSFPATAAIAEQKLTGGESTNG